MTAAQRAAIALPATGLVVYQTDGTAGLYRNLDVPTAPLGFAASLGKKITLYPGGTGDAGFGMAANQLQVFGDNPSADVALGYDVAGTFNERFAFKPTGAIAVNGNAGAAGQVLQSNGAASPATWVSPTNSAYNNIYQVSSQAQATLTDATVTLAPGMSQSFSVGGNAHVLASAAIRLTAVSRFACGSSHVWVELFLDGVVENVWDREIGNGVNESVSGTMLLDVGAGTHTVEVRVVRDMGNTVVVGPGGGMVHDTLTLQVVPQ